VQVSITIECDNASFRPLAGTELARILREIAADVDGKDLLDHDQVKLFDENGNDVGLLRSTGRIFPDLGAEGYQPAGGNPAEMLEKLRQGIRLTAGDYHIWATPGSVWVAQDVEDDDAVEHPLSVSGLLEALKHAGMVNSEA
jgi:hypothetical protein